MTAVDGPVKGVTMNEQELIQLWHKNWNRIVISQFAPTLLLITTVALAQFGLAQTPLLVRWATILILLASGILGALAQFTSAEEAKNVASALKKSGKGPVIAGIQRQTRYLGVVQFVTPTIFVAIFVILAFALLG
jgi:hypothetical protein